MCCCRVCLDPCEPITSLGDIFKNKMQRVTYLEAFNMCTNLAAELSDEYPQWLCKLHSKRLQLLYEFCYIARQSDVKLKRLKETKHLLLNIDDETSGEHKLVEHEADAEICAFDNEIHINMKDPLEDSTDEDEKVCEPDKELMALETLREDCESYDEDDNKPLKALLEKVTKIPAVEIVESEIFNEVEETKKLSVDNVTDAYVDIYALEANDAVNNVPDLALSAEEQLFPQGRYKCKKCDKRYFTIIGLKAHLDVHLPKVAKTTRKRVRGPNRKLRKSKQQNSNDEFISMDSKDSALESVTQLKNVKVKKNIITSEGKQKLPKPKKTFPCHVCGKHMISASKFRYHMVMHTGEKDYLCSICPKAYSTIYALNHHLRTHTGERPYECKYCGDRFHRTTTLKSHMRRHTGERPYGCDICGKRFIQHSSMTTHMKLNHMAKTISCPQCDKKYARQTDLNTHLISHSGNKPFSCQLCSSRFIRQANLNKHMNQQHAVAKLIECQTNTQSINIVEKGSTSESTTTVSPITEYSKIKGETFASDDIQKCKPMLSSL